MKKMWRENSWFRNICMFLFGLIVGVILMIGIYSIMGMLKNFNSFSEVPVSNTDELSVSESDSTVLEDDDIENSETDEEETKDGKTEEGKDVSAAEPSKKNDKEKETSVTYSGDYKEWNESAVYNSGDLVVYNNHIYKAKWWTQGEKPGTVDVWEDTKETPVAKEEKKDPIKDKKVNVVNDKKASDEEFKVVVYYPSWEPYETDKIDYKIVTHVNYAFAIPQSDATLRALESPETVKFLIKEAHANNRKVLMAVGGWSYNGTPLESTFNEATDSSEKIKKFGDNIIKMCDEYGFDGVDMDWEHPRVDGTSSKQYEELMLYLAEKLHAQDKLLTSAVLSGATADGNIYYDAAAHTDAVLNAVDWINIMAYDGGDGERHSSYDFAINSGNYWLQKRGMEAHKVVLGVPFYARPSWAAYDEILQSDSSAYSKDVTTYNGMEAHYNGVDTIKAKTDYAVKNFGGIMVWEITQDTSDKEHSLLQAIGDAIK